MYGLRKKIIGLRNRIRHEWNAHRHHSQLRKEERAYHRWRNKFKETENELLIGSNFDLNGGVRNHIHSIHRFTKFRSELIPSDPLLRKFGKDVFVRNISDFLLAKPSRFVRICHSHVSPWFINWCFAHQDSFVWAHTHHAWYHEDTVNEGLETWQRELNEAGLFALKHCHRPIVVSRWQKQFLKETFAVEAEYVPNGVDTDICGKGNADRFRKTHRIKNPYILWLGRNESVKNPLELLRAASQLPNIDFVVAGNACGKLGLERLLGHELPRNVLAIGDLDRIAAQDAIAACFALVVTSKREGLPTLVLEAMIHGKPIVTSDAEGCLDAIDGGKYGFVYTRGNVSQLIEQLQRVSIERKRNEGGYRFAMQEFSWNNVICKLENTYLTGTH
jgi:glycosyltransferase involved in cell wall biosynthesis